jgi:molybdopterin-guanine dinucleotide biosynthesis protein B
MPAKAIAITGYKNSGKTRVVEALTKELTKRGYKVGTIKHSADDINLDTPGKDTARHRASGSIATALLQENTAAIFLDMHLTIQQATEKLGPFDYLLIEGFKTKDTQARIIVPRNDEELMNLRNGLEIAAVKVPDSTLCAAPGLPLYTLDQVSELADLVESRAFPMLSGLDCHSCGYHDCLSMGIGILAGEATITQCVGYGSTFSLKVNDLNVPLGNFTREVLQNVILGFVKTLKGGEEARKIHLEFEQE